MGSENSKSGLEKGPGKQIENMENSINFLNSNNSISSKKNEKTKFSNYGPMETTENQNRLIQISFKWVEGGSVVYVTGTFTNWRNHILMNRVINEFHLVLSLSPGVYEYKYIVDGVWKYSIHDPTINDEHGNINNLIDTDAIERKNQILNHLNNADSANSGNLYYGHYNFNAVNDTPKVDYQKTSIEGSEDEYRTKNKGNELNKYLATKKDSSHLNIETNIRNSENNFNEEAPEVPSYLLSIPFLAEKENHAGIFWKSPINSVNKNCMEMEGDYPYYNEDKTSKFLKLLDHCNNLKPPTHVVINHMGAKGSINKKYCAFCYTQRYKGKYATLKFYTFK